MSIDFEIQEAVQNEISNVLASFFAGIHTMNGHPCYSGDYRYSSAGYQFISIVKEMTYAFTQFVPSPDVRYWIDPQFHMAWTDPTTGNLRIPSPNQPGDAGYDLYCCGEFVPKTDNEPAKVVPGLVVLQPGQHKLIETGIAFSFQPQWKVEVLPRGSTLTRTHLIVIEAVGDSGYTGTYKIQVYNTSSEPVVIEEGQRIAQACFVQVGHPNFTRSEESLDPTARGEGAIGSTGR